VKKSHPGHNVKQDKNLDQLYSSRGIQTLNNTGASTSQFITYRARVQRETEGHENQVREPSTSPTREKINQGKQISYET